MIPGIIAWVRKKINQLKTYIRNWTYAGQGSSITGGGHKFRFGGYSYYIELAHSPNKIIISGAVSNVISSTEDLIEWDVRYLDFQTFYYLPLHGANKFILFIDESGVPGETYMYVLHDGSDEWVRHTANIETSGNSFGCGAYINGQFIVFLEDTNRYYTSIDGLVWVERTLPSSAKWNILLYRNGRFLIAASNWKDGYISNDGINWTLTGISSTTDYVSGTVSDTGYAVIKSYSPNASFSANGVNWVQFTLPDKPVDPNLSVRYKKIVYGVGLYLLIFNYTNVYYTSTDLITWTAGTLPYSLYEERDIIFKDDKFIFAGFTSAGTGKVAIYSYDGITWHDEPLVNPPYNDFCHKNGLISAVSYERIWHVSELNTDLSQNSGNSINHYVKDIKTPRIVNRVSTDGVIFVSISFLGNVSFTSTDGINWTEHQLPITSTWTCFKYLNGVFILIGGIKTLLSTDGVTWTEGIMPIDVNWADVTYGNGLFAAISNTYIDEVQPYVCSYSADGLVWTLNALPLASATSIAFGDGVFKILGSASDIVLTTPDCLIWESVQLPSTSAVFWKLILYVNGLFVAFSNGNDGALYSEKRWVFQEYISSPNLVSVIAVDSIFCKLYSDGQIRREVFTEVVPPSPPVFIGSSVFNAELTSFATVNTYDIPVTLTVGQVLKFGTEILAGASTPDDTFIRLTDPDGIEVASNDDYDTLASYVEYTALLTGTYTMRIGCYSDTVCTGTVVWEVCN